MSDEKEKQTLKIKEMLQEALGSMDVDDILSIKQLLDDREAHALYEKMEECRNAQLALMKEMSDSLAKYGITTEKYLNLKPKQAFKLLLKQHRIFLENGSLSLHEDFWATMKPHTSSYVPRQAKHYQNPNDPTQKWVGKGKRPRWLNAYLDAGGNLADIEVKHFDSED